MRQEENAPRNVYLMQSGEADGPYTRDEIGAMLRSGSLDGSSLVKIGADGRVFSAASLADHAGEENSGQRVF